MTELHDLIRTEFGVGDDSYFLSPENMRAAIAAVLDIHKLVKIPRPVCAVCSEDNFADDYAADYPCPTVRVIAEKLGLIAAVET